MAIQPRRRGAYRRFSPAAARWPFAVIFLALSGFAGCAEVDGTDPYALWNTYDHPSGLFHFHYLSPPWHKLQTQFDEDKPVLVIEQDTVLADGGVDFEFRLEAFVISVIEENDIESACDAVEAKWEDRGFAFGPRTDIVSAGGDSGLRSSGRSGDMWIAVAYQRSGHSVAVMEVTGKVKVDTADVELLLDSLEPRRSKEE